MTPAAHPPSLQRLEDAVEQWVAKKSGRLPSELREELSLPQGLARRVTALEKQIAAQVDESRETLATLLAQPEAARAAWIDQRSWGENGALLGEALLEEAERRPLVDRLEFARLAARVSSRAKLPTGANLFEARLDDNLGRAGLIEVRSLRRRGELASALRRFAELGGLLDDTAPMRFWLTLEAERCLTAGLLARDEGHLKTSAALLHRTERLLRVAGSEQDDAELLAAQVRTDLARGDATRAVARFPQAPEMPTHQYRVESGFLLALAALRTTSPLLARHALLGLTSELGPRPTLEQADHLQLLEAAVKLAESQPAVALEALPGVAERLRAAGSLEGSLRAAIVAARAEQARRRPARARAELAAGVIESFQDLPATPAVQAALRQVSERAAAGGPSPEFLDRLELWLILAVDSPGVELRA